MCTYKHSTNCDIGLFYFHFPFLLSLHPSSSSSSSAEPTDTGRYGVMATNAAGRAESLADVMVTPLIMDKAPITHTITFTDVTDEAKVCVWLGSDTPGGTVREGGRVSQCEGDMTTV